MYVIESLARELARSTAVNLAVRKGPTRPIAGVRVLSAPGLSAEELPDAEVVIGGLAQPDPERVLALPASKGVQLFFFQGYGTPGNPRVTAMLERRPRVLAVSSFLLERARGHGCEAELVRPGLERTMFHAGPPAERARAGRDDDDPRDRLEGDAGWAGRARARARGDSRCGAEAVRRASSRESPPRFSAGCRSRRSAELLREAAVLVLPSWEEGLGLPGNRGACMRRRAGEHGHQGRPRLRATWRDGARHAPRTTRSCWPTA